MHLSPCCTPSLKSWSLFPTGTSYMMAISYMIMKEHQGWIEARNEHNRVVFDGILPRS